MILYHGSQVENFTPTYGLGNDTHDYGRGFYTTADRELGKEWAVGQIMEHPYDKVYLSDVVEEQGKFFERLQDLPEPIDSADFITAYMHGYTRRQLDEGHAYYLTLDANRMKEVFLQESGYIPKRGEPLRGFMPNWIGQFYACAQWYWNVSSAELCDRLSVESLCAVYPGAHDLDLKTAVEKLGRPIFAGKTI